MSKTLNLSDQLFDLARTHSELGRDREALQLLDKLIRLGNLAPAAAEEVQVLAAEIHLRNGRLDKARRHLQVALTWQPEAADYHHLMAIVLEESEDHDRRALHHYRNAADLAPEEPQFQCDYGEFLIVMGETTKGLRRLGKAVELAPDAVEFLEPYVLALIDADKSEQARRVVLFARFRNPHCPHLQRLWNKLNFHQTRREQDVEKQTYRTVNGGPVLLPFLRPPMHEAMPKTHDECILRLDAAAKPGVEKLPRLRRKPRHAEK